jgi:hypothetical protein
VVQDEDGALVRREAPETALELVAVGHSQRRIRRLGPVQREDSQIRHPTSLAGGLLDADVREHAVDPGVESIRIAEARKATPGDHQRVLQGIVGSIDIPEDPMRDREEPITTRMDQVHEGILVTTLRRLDEIAIHRRSVVLTSVGDVFHRDRGMVASPRWNSVRPVRRHGRPVSSKSV